MTSSKRKGAVGSGAAESVCAWDWATESHTKQVACHQKRNVLNASRGRMEQSISQERTRQRAFQEFEGVPTEEMESLKNSVTCDQELATKIVENCSSHSSAWVERQKSSSTTHTLKFSGAALDAGLSEYFGNGNWSPR